MRNEMASPWIGRRRLKRALDIVFVTVAAPLVLPLAGLVALTVWATMGCPVLFRQFRPGFGERPFVIFKFRTMRTATGPDGHEPPDGERLTVVGRLLRRSSLDELPELLNVLRGEMSLVGPRPLLRRYLPWFTERERLRFTVPPGITGLAQISGRNLATWSERLAIDVAYVERWSLALDIRIMLHTLPAVLTSRGVVPDARSAMLNLDEERGQHAGAFHRKP